MTPQSFPPDQSSSAGALPRLPRLRPEAIRTVEESLAQPFRALAEQLRARTAELHQARQQLAQEVARRGELELALQNAREDAEAATRAKSQFLAVVSHELRTPLNVILGYGELLAEQAQQRGDRNSAHDLETILAAGRHLLGLINDVLDLSHLEAGGTDLCLESVPLDALMQEAVSAARPRAEQNGNMVVVHSGEGLGSIRTDPAKLRQILAHLLGNAGKFTHGGTVTLEVEREGSDRVLLRVSDTGIGMTPEELGCVFRPFIQADGSSTRRYGGLGVGLALTRRFTELLGGAVSVQSKPNVGTTVTLRLPRRGPAPREPPRVRPRSRRWLGTRAAVGRGPRSPVLAADEGYIRPAAVRRRVVAEA